MRPFSFNFLRLSKQIDVTAKNDKIQYFNIEYYICNFDFLLVVRGTYFEVSILKTPRYSQFENLRNARQVFLRARFPHDVMVKTTLILVK